MASEGKAPTNVETRIVQHTKPCSEENTLNSSPQCGNNYQPGQQSRPTNNILNNTNNHQQQDTDNPSDKEALKKFDSCSNNSIEETKSVPQADIIDDTNSDRVSPPSVEQTVTSELLTSDKSYLLKANNKPAAENNMTQENIPPESSAKQSAGMRRNASGCKSSEFYQWSEQPFDDMDSPLAVQQYIQQVIRRDPRNVDEILTPPEGQDLGAWKFEHLRQFCMQLNKLAARLQDCCQPQICNQMTATEQWIFLCAAHKTPNECSAIDYTRHTLDSAASLLNNNKYFPSRVTIKESTVAKLGSISRRIYRIFSHAYYHHFQVFDQFERETFLCRRFTKFVTKYSLVSKDNLIVPIDGESSITNTVSQKSPTPSPNELEQQSKDLLDANVSQSEESLDLTVAENKTVTQASEISSDSEPPVSASNDTKSNNLLPHTNASSDEVASASNTSTMVKGSMSSALSTSPAGISGAMATSETSSPSSDVAVPAADPAPNNA